MQNLPSNQKVFKKYAFSANRILMEDKKDDDEISIDLSKIKNLFKRKKEEKPEVHKTPEAVD